MKEPVSFCPWSLEVSTWSTRQRLLSPFLSLSFSPSMYVSFSDSFAVSHSHHRLCNFFSRLGLPLFVGKFAWKTKNVKGCCSQESTSVYSESQICKLVYSPGSEPLAKGIKSKVRYGYSRFFYLHFVRALYNSISIFCSFIPLRDWRTIR